MRITLWLPLASWTVALLAPAPGRAQDSPIANTGGGTRACTLRWSAPSWTVVCDGHASPACVARARADLAPLPGHETVLVCDSQDLGTTWAIVNDTSHQALLARGGQLEEPQVFDLTDDGFLDVVAVAHEEQEEWARHTLRVFKWVDGRMRVVYDESAPGQRVPDAEPSLAFSYGRWKIVVRGGARSRRVWTFEWSAREQRFVPDHALPRRR